MNVWFYFAAKGVSNPSSVGERPELSWPSNPPSIPNSSHPPHGLVTSLAGYPPGSGLPTPPPNLLPSLPVSAGVNGLNPNFNLSLNINPRLLGPAHMAHPLTSLINSLHGISSKSSPTALSAAPVLTAQPPQPPQTQHQQHETIGSIGSIVGHQHKNHKQQQQQEQQQQQPDSDRKPVLLVAAAGLKAENKLVDPICVAKSAFHQVTPALTLEETSKSESSCSPSLTSRLSPSTNNNPAQTKTDKISSSTITPVSITTAIVNQTKTVWRPY